MEITLDANIIKVLPAEHSPDSAPNPKITSADNKLLLHPELVTKGEVINIALLTDTRPTEAAVSFNPLGDVAIETGDHEALESRRKRRVKRMAWVASVLVAMMLSANITGIITYLNRPSTAANSTETFYACFSMLNDNNVAVSLLQLVQTQTSAIPEKSSDSQDLLKSYDQLLHVTSEQLS